MKKRIKSAIGAGLLMLAFSFTIGSTNTVKADPVPGGGTYYDCIDYYDYWGYYLYTECGYYYY